MSEVLVIERIISLGHATKICKVLNQKKHREAPLRIELEELDFKLGQIPRWHISNATIFDTTGLVERGLVYSSYKGVYYETELAYHLKVFREIQPKE